MCEIVFVEVGEYGDGDYFVVFFGGGFGVFYYCVFVVGVDCDDCWFEYVD